MSAKILPKSASSMSENVGARPSESGSESTAGPLSANTLTCVEASEYAGAMSVRSGENLSKVKGFDTEEKKTKPFERLEREIKRANKGCAKGMSAWLHMHMLTEDIDVLDFLIKRMSVHLQKLENTVEIVGFFRALRAIHVEFRSAPETVTNCLEYLEEAMLCMPRDQKNHPNILGYLHTFRNTNLMLAGHRLHLKRKKTSGFEVFWWVDSFLNECLTESGRFVQWREDIIREIIPAFLFKMTRLRAKLKSRLDMAKDMKTKLFALSISIGFAGFSTLGNFLISLGSVTGGKGNLTGLF